jgi:putative phosphoesterase
VSLWNDAPSGPRLALVADIHDHVAALHGALPHWREQSDALLLLGDLVAPFVLRHLASGYPKPIALVFGNNDGDRQLLTQVAAGSPQVRIHGEFLRGEFAGRRVASTHYPAIAEALDPRAFDLIAFGHDHRARIQAREGAKLVNPGTLLGFDPGRDAAVPVSWAIYDTEGGAVDFWQLTGRDVALWHP